MKHSYLNMVKPVYSAALAANIGTEIETDRISLKHYQGVVFIVQMVTSATSDDTTVRLREHTAASSGNSKGLLPRAWYRAQAADVQTAAGSAVTEVTPVAAGCPAEGANENLIYCEIDASELDLSNDYQFVSCVIDDVSGDANKVASVTVLAVGARQATDPTELLSAIA